MMQLSDLYDADLCAWNPIARAWRKSFWVPNPLRGAQCADGVWRDCPGGRTQSISRRVAEPQGRIVYGSVMGQ